MSKKDKKIKSITESVGDTSGFDDQAPKFDKKRKITLIAGISGIVVLLVFAIIFFVTPVTVEFIYLDNATTNEHYRLSKTTGLLEEAPKDPTKPNYYFAGWYFSDNFTNGELYNNDKDKSLLEYKFSTKNKVTLYAKWLPIEYEITYDIQGKGEYRCYFNEEKMTNLKELNKKINPKSYSVKHELKEYEKTAYVEYLRELDPDKYVKSKDAEKNINNALEFYSNEAQKSSVILNGFNDYLEELDIQGWTFLGWFDENGNQVTELNKQSPKALNLTARWEQN